MSHFKPSTKSPKPSQVKPFIQKKHPVRFQNQQNQLGNPQMSPNNFIAPNSKRPTHKYLPIKDYKLKISQNGSFLASKTLKRKSSILSNIYRPKHQTNEEVAVKSYLEIKNINLIKENIKKLEISIPQSIPNLLKNSNMHKFRLNGSLKQQCKTQRSTRESSHRQPVFMFPNEPLHEIFTKRRKLSHHFDRSKYFNCEPFLSKEQKDISFRRQKTEYRINASLVKEKMMKEKIQDNRCLVDQVIPIIKQRANKPKTAGGFLKRYSVEQVCIRPDFQLHLTDEDIF